MDWFDAHLDLGYLAQMGRDMTLPLASPNGGPKPAAVTLPSLREGGIRWAMATIYTSPSASGVLENEGCYGGPADVAGAHAAGVAGLRIYQDWESRGLVRIVRRAAELGALDEPAGVGEPLRIVLLMEGADPIREPDEAGWWFEQGLRMVGLAWREGTRYAGGDASPAERGGLSDEGCRLVEQFDRLGIIHDLSHLNDASAWQLLKQARGPVVATHSTSRRVQGVERQRFLTDELIAEVARRGGMVGLPLYSPFLAVGKGRATIARAVDHVEHIAKVMGHRHGVGLGSDMDGGFGADEMPEGIDEPADLAKLAEALGARGWSGAEVAGFRTGNWWRYLAGHLPR